MTPHAQVTAKRASADRAFQRASGEASVGLHVVTSASIAIRLGRPESSISHIHAIYSQMTDLYVMRMIAENLGEDPSCWLVLSDFVTVSLR